MARWHEAEERAVATKLAHMLTVYTAGKPEDKAARVDAYIDVLVEHGDCPNCIIWAIDDAEANRHSLPTPAVILEHYEKATAEVHHHHRRLAPGTVDVGGIEAWWRTKGADVVKEFVHDPVLALAIVGQMWSSGFVTQDEDHVREEMALHGATLYVPAMKAFLNGTKPSVPPRAKAERLIDKCVKQTAEGEHSLNLSEVELKTASRYERNLATAKA